MAALAKGWRYRFHSLDESDFNVVSDGSEFFVNYIGCTAISEDHEIPSDTQIDDFFVNVVSQSKQSPVNLQLCTLTVNEKGSMICDSEGDTLLSFESYNICYVTTTSTWKYSKYFIIVAKTRHEQSLKGHVLLCKNKSNAKRICQTFTEMFKMQAVPAVAITISAKPGVPKAGTFRLKQGSQSRNEHAFCSVKNPVEITFDRQNDDKHEELFDDGFTELARSRSSSSDVTAPLSDSFSKEIITPHQLDDSVFY